MAPVKRKQHRVIWTGFGPFGDGEGRIAVNPSQRLVDRLEAEFEDDTFRLVNVSMTDAKKCVEALKMEADTVCVHLGVAADYGKVTLERRAQNETVFRCKDEEGCQPESGAVDDQGPKAMATTIDLEEIKKILGAKDLEVDVSDDAGLFVCNYLYYKSLRESETKENCWSLFVHVPPFATVPEETQLEILRELRALLVKPPNQGPAMPSMPLDLETDSAADPLFLKKKTDDVLVAANLIALGVSDQDAQRAIAGGSTTVDEALDWLFSNQLTDEEEKTVVVKPKEKNKSLSTTETKLVLVVRSDLGMSRGKISAQCCHAALGANRAVAENRPALAIQWLAAGEKTVVLSASGNSFDTLEAKARDAKVPTYLVRDAGKTEVEPNTATVLAVGPDFSETIDTITGHLSLLADD